jgi:glycosyltransferase involved in cell wall biosynthesis
MRTRLPADLFWPVLRRFHGSASAVLVATDTVRDELRGRGLPQTHIWARGVDLALFSPDNPRLAGAEGLPGPIQLYVGRVSVEKNIEAFLRTALPGTKLIVGDGPARAQLAARFPDALFLGPLHGARLAAAYASADVFVFPSRTDTFGVVQLEALACGVPVAAFPITGPKDVVGSHPIGALNEDLRAACLDALAMSRGACRAFALNRSWSASARQFIAHVQKVATRGTLTLEAAIAVTAPAPC